MRRLSELEGVSIGIVDQNEPCTAYLVTQKLKEAPSSHWRASAGSVYPLLARLESEGLISSVEDKRDRRGRSLLSVTPRGRRALVNWIEKGLDIEVISSTFDPIRTRTFFLGALSLKDRIDYVERLARLMDNYMADVTAHLKGKSKSEDLFDYLGSLGAERVTAARVDWLKTVMNDVRESAERSRGSGS